MNKSCYYFNRMSSLKWTYIFEDMHTSVDLNHKALVVFELRASQDCVQNKVDAFNSSQLLFKPIARSFRGES